MISLILKLLLFLFYIFLELELELLLQLLLTFVFHFFLKLALELLNVDLAEALVVDEEMRSLMRHAVIQTLIGPGQHFVRLTVARFISLAKSADSDRGHLNFCFRFTELIIRVGCSDELILLLL